MATTSSQQQVTGLNIGVLPTQELIQQCQTQWQSIRDNSSDDDARKFEMFLVSLCSRVQAYHEVFSGGNIAFGGQQQSRS